MTGFCWWLASANDILDEWLGCEFLLALTDGIQDAWSSCVDD
jgi:hypothetical protein